MSDEVSLDIEIPDIQPRIERNVRALRELERAVEQLAKNAGIDVSKLGGTLDELKNDLDREVTAVKKAMNIAIYNLKTGANEVIQIRQGMMAARRQEYEYGIALAKRMGKELTIAEIKEFQNTGVTLLYEHRKRLSEYETFMNKHRTLAAGLQADQLKDELEYQKSRQVIAEAVQADMLKDELAFQKLRQTEAEGLQADMVKDELAFQKLRQVAAEGVQADMLKDELAFQKLRQTESEGLQADMVKDELAFQKLRQTLAEAMQADMLKDELAFQALRKTEAEGLQADMVKDELAYQKQRQIAAEGMQADMLKDELAFQKARQTIAAKAVADREALAKQAVSRATYQAEGSYSEINTGRLVDPKSVQGATSMSRALKQLTIDGNDAHSMARGLASGFNLLWLTWGNLAPLFAGAAISFGVKSVVSMGADVQNTFETIRVLSEETTGSVAALNEQMLQLARTGPFGPREIAEAMKTLSLAGLSAAEVSASIKDVLNFSVAGTTGIKQAADVMTSVATAFSITAEGYNYVGDVISKTAAVSKSSVESIGEAFKTASVLGKQYGVSLEDVGVGLAALANLGIQGSAAGTALRNMYVDLSGRTPKVQKALASVNLELRQSNGRFKDIVTIAREVSGALDGMQSNIDKKNFLRDALSERGSKPIIELVDLANRESRKMGTTAASWLAELSDKINNASGFMVKAAAQMALTPLNQMKSVASSLQATIVESFNGLEPVVFQVSQRLREAFASEEFKSGLNSLMSGVAKLTILIVENLDVLGKLAIAYAAFKTAQLTANVFSGLATGLAAMAASATAATGAIAGAAATTSRFVGWGSKLLGFLGPIGALLSAGATAWQLYDLFHGNANKTAQDGVTSGYMDAYISKLEEETARLNENTEAMRRNISVEELRLEKQRQGIAGKIAQGGGTSPAVVNAQAELAKAEADLVRIQAAAGKSEFKSYAPERQAAVVAKARAELAAALSMEKEIQRLQARRLAAKTEDAEVAARANKEEAIRKAEKDRLDAENRLGSTKFGVSDTATDAELRRMLSAAEKAYEEKQKLLQESLKRELDFLRDSYSTSQSVLDNRHRNELVSEGEYQAESLAAIIAYEEKAAQARNKASEEFVKNSDARAAFLGSQFSGEKLKEELGKLSAALKAFAEANDLANTKQLNDALERTTKAVQNTEGATLKATKATQKFSEENLRELQTQLDITAESYDKFANAARKAALEQGNKYANKIAELEVMAKKAEETAAYMATSDYGTTMEGARAIASAKNQALDLRAEIARLGGERMKAEGMAAEAAVAKLKNADFAEFSKKVSDAIIKGGEEGASDLRKVLEDEFLNKPIRILLEGLMSDIRGGGGNGLQSALGQVQGTFDALTSGGAGVGLGSPTADLLKAGLSYLNNGALRGVNSVAGSLTKAGFTTLSSYVNEAGAMLSEGATSISQFVGKFSSQINTVSNGLSYLNMAVLATEGKWGAAIGAAIGNTWGPIGSFIGQKIGGWVDNLFGGGRSYSKGGGITGTFSSSGFSGSEYSVTREEPNQFNSWFGASGKDVESSKAMSTAASEALGAQFKALQNNTTAFGAALGLNTEAVKSYTTTIKVVTLTTEEAAQVNDATKVLNDAGASTTAKAEAQKTIDDLSAKANKAIVDNFTTISKEMAGLIVGTEFIRMGETADAALARMATSLTVVNETAKLFGDTLLDVSEKGGSAASALIDAFGGLENYTTTMQSYFANTFTEAERKQKDQAALDAKFGGLGLSTPKTAAEYRSLVSAADKNKGTPEGATAYATLLSLNDALFELIPTADEAAEKLKDLTATNVDLTDQLNKLTLTEDAYRATKVAGMTAEETAMYDSNDALTKAIKAREDEADAAKQAAKDAEDAAKQAIKDAEERAKSYKELENRLAILKGTETERSIALRDAADGYTRSLLTQIYAQEDLNALTEKNNDLKDKLNALLGKETDLSLALRDAKDETTKQLLRDIAAAERVKAENETNASLKDKLAILLGKETELTIALRDAKEESTRGLLEEIDAAERENELRKKNADLTDRLNILRGKETELSIALRDNKEASTQQLLIEIDLLEKANALAEINAPLQDRLNILTGKETELSIALRDAKDDSTKALTLEIAYQEKLADRLKTNNELRDKLAILLGTETERSIALRDSLDESTDSLLRQVYAAEDLKEATEKAIEAEKALADERSGLISSLRSAMEDTKGLRSDALAKLDPSNRPLQQAIYDIEDVRASIEKAKEASDKAATATDKAMQGLERAVEAEKKLVQAQLDAAKKTLESVKAIFETISGAVKELYGETAATAAMQASAGQSVIDQAVSTGVLPSNESLSEAIKAVRDGMAGSIYASKFDEDNARLVFAGKLSSLKEAAQSGITAAEQQVALAEASLASLDAQLAAAQASLDAMRGVDNSTKSVTTATQTLQTAMKAEADAKKIQDDLTTVTLVTAITNAATAIATALASVANAAAGAAAAANAAAASKPAAPDSYTPKTGGGVYTGSQGVTLTSDGMLRKDDASGTTLMWAKDAANLLNDYGNVHGRQAAVARAAELGINQDMLDKIRTFRPGVNSFEVGTNYVRDTGLALLHEGEAVIPKAFNPEAFGGTIGGDQAVIDVLERVAEYLVTLEEDARATAISNAKILKLLDRVIPEGTYVATKAV